MTVSGIRIKLNIVACICAGVLLISGNGVQLGISLAVLCIHECAHVLAARLVGVRISRIDVQPYGGVAWTEGNDYVGTWRENVIAAAGPVANIITALVLIALNRYFPLAQEAEYALQSTLMMAAVNILPVMPLDGGRILRCTLMHVTFPRRAERICALFGRTVAALLLIGVLWLAVNGFINYTLIVMALFILYSSFSSNAFSVLRTLRGFDEKDDKLKNGEALAVRHIAVGSNTAPTRVLNALSANKYNIVTVISENGECVTVGEERVFQWITEGKIELISRSKNDRISIEQ